MDTSVRVACGKTREWKAAALGERSETRTFRSTSGPDPAVEDIRIVTGGDDLDYPFSECVLVDW